MCQNQIALCCKDRREFIVVKYAVKYATLKILQRQFWETELLNLLLDAEEKGIERTDFVLIKQTLPKPGNAPKNSAKSQVPSIRGSCQQSRICRIAVRSSIRYRCNPELCRRRYLDDLGHLMVKISVSDQNQHQYHASATNPFMRVQTHDGSSSEGEKRSYP